MSTFLKKQSPRFTNIVQVFQNVDFVQVLKIVQLSVQVFYIIIQEISKSPWFLG